MGLLVVVGCKIKVLADTDINTSRKHCLLQLADMCISKRNHCLLYRENQWLTLTLAVRAPRHQHSFGFSGRQSNDFITYQGNFNVQTLRHAVHSLLIMYMFVRIRGFKRWFCGCFCPVCAFFFFMMEFYHTAQQITCAILVDINFKHHRRARVGVRITVWARKADMSISEFNYFIFKYTVLKKVKTSAKILECHHHVNITLLVHY